MAAFMAAWGALWGLIGQAAARNAVLTNLVNQMIGIIPTPVQVAQLATAYAQLRQTALAFSAQYVILNANLAAALAQNVAGAQGNRDAALDNLNDMRIILIAARGLGLLFGGPAAFPAPGF